MAISAERDGPLESPRSVRPLEGRVGVLEKLLKVGLEPRTGLGGGLEGVVLAAVVVVADGRGVRGAVALAAGLDPDEGVDERRARVGGRPRAEAGADGVAPVTPRLLAGRLLAGAALVDDELGVPALCGEEGSEGLNVALLVEVGVA